MKKIIIIEPSSSGIGLIKQGYDLGFNIIVFTYNGNDRVIPQEFLKFAGKVVEIDTNKHQAVIDEAIRLHESSPISAVLPGFEYYVPLAAHISHQLGLPGLPLESVNALRYKNIMRKSLEAQGIRVPKSMVIKDSSELVNATKYVGFPCVLKPIDLSGSIHVSKTENISQLEVAYELLCTDTFVDFDHSLNSTVLLEEYIAGDEFSVEGYVQDGIIHFVSLTEKLLTPEPYFVEIGHIVQAELPDNISREILNYTESIIKTLQVNLGVFHCEVRVAEEGPILMEIAARLPGDKICDLIFSACGVNLYEVMIMTYLGEHFLLQLTQTQKFAGICFIISNTLKKYQKIDGLEILQNISGFQEFGILIPPGDIIPKPTNFRGRIAYAIFVADSYQSVKAKLSKVNQVLRFQ
jgi:biotin carboxylase